MAWYFHSTQQPDGSWACQHGLTSIDTHGHVHDSLDHLRDLADKLGGTTQYVLHFLNGRVETVEWPPA